MYLHFTVIHSLILIIYKHLDPSDINRLCSYFLDQYTCFKPKIGLLAIVVTMMAGLLAISLPLVVSGISRILDRYQSEVISRILQKKWEYKLSIFSGIAVVIVLCIIGAFIEKSAEIIGIWKILYCINLILFITFLVTFLLLFFSAIKYSNNSKYILQEFADSNREILHFLKKEGNLSKKKLDKLQKRLLDNLEGIGDVLSLLSPRIKYNLYVTEQLDELSSITKNFIRLIKQHPERFTLLSFSNDYGKIFLKQDKDSQLKKWGLDHFPENNFIVFSSLINQIARIHQQAFIHSNLKINLETIRFVIRSLKYLSVESDQEAVIKFYLTQLYYREFDCDGEENLEHYKTIAIYFRIVFGNKFRLEYLHLFDYYLFEQFKYIVNENRVQSIIDLSSSATRNHQVIPSDRYNIFSGYREFKNTNRKSLESLSVRLKNIRLYSEIQECCQEFNRLAKLDSNEQEVLRYKNDFEWSAIEYYKYNHLQDIVFALGAYCVYKKNFGLIYQLWEFNQPEDSTANILNPAIVPTLYGELLHFYFGTLLEQRTSAIYWDQNHGKERYYHLYFILALVRAFSTPTGKKVNISTVKVNWNRFNSSQISNINYEMKIILDNFQFLEQYKQHFADLHLSIAVVDYIVINKVKPLLRHLKKQIPLVQNHILLSSNISNNKVEEFKQKFSEQYKVNSQLRKLYIFYGTYQCNLNKMPSKILDFFGFDSEVRKDSFIENWYCEPPNYANNCANLMAKDENLYILEQWENRCIDYSNSSLDSILNNVANLNETIIVTDSLNYQQVMQQLPNFDSKFKRVNDKNFPQLFGTYSRDTTQIPIIYLSISGQQLNKIFVINKSTIGQWSQYCPLEYPEDSLSSIFDITIKPVANNADLQKYYRQKYKDYVATNYPEPKKQQDWLDSLVQVKIYQKFDLELADNFQGYFIEVETY